MGETEEFKNRATRKLRMRPLAPKELPPHPVLEKLQADQSKAVDLRHFVNEVLEEAIEFSDSVIPSTFQKKGSPKSSPPSTAKVQLLSSDLIQGETWFARQSIHENAPLDGSADFEEFENGLYDNHSINEAEYTPNVYDAHKVLDYSESIKAIEGDFGEVFEEVSMEIYEMAHQIPSPLSNRAFAVLVTRAFLRPGSFILVQIPVDISKVSEAFYSNGKNTTQGDTAQKREKVVIGQYCSLERVREQDDGNVIWEMATASDAKGNLPMALQKMGVPGAVVKDVGLFMTWASERRKQST